MKKEEFLAQENVPQFIKDLVANAPDGAEVAMEVVKVSGSPKEENDTKTFEDGLDVSDHLSNIADQLVTVIESCDSKGNLENDPKVVQKAVLSLGIVQHVAGELSKYILEHHKC